MLNKPEPLLFLSDARGVYIPRDFANNIRHECVTGLTADDWDILANPEHEHHLEVWCEVTDYDNVRVHDPANGVTYRVYQDGDVWLVPLGMEWNDSTEWYEWPVESSTA